MLILPWRLYLATGCDGSERDMMKGKELKWDG